MDQSCWTCGGSHKDDACPHRVANSNPVTPGLPPREGPRPPLNLPSAALQQTRSEATNDDVGNSIYSNRVGRQLRSDGNAGEVANNREPILSGAADQGVNRRESLNQRDQEAPLGNLASVLDRHVGVERLSVMVLRQTLLELLVRPPIWLALLLAGMGLCLGVISHPYLALLLSLLGGYLYLWPGQRWKLPRVFRMKQPDGWRVCFYAIWILPSLLEVSGQYGLFTLVAKGGSGLNWGLLAVFAIFVAGSWPVVCRRGTTGRRGLPAKWKALLGCLKAFTALVLVCWGVVMWNVELVMAASRSCFLLMAMLLLRSVPTATLTHAAKVGVCKTVEKASRSFTEEVTGDSILQLALLRWLLEYWTQPTNYSGTDFGSMLQQIIEALKSELNRTVVPQLEKLHRTLYETDIETDAKPLVARTQNTLVTLSPTLGVAQWVHVTGRLPSSLAFLLVALVRGQLALPLLPLVALEARLVHHLLEDLATKTGPREGEGSNLLHGRNGMWVLLWGSGYEDSLCRVWENLCYAVDECLPRSLTALRVYQTSTRSVNVANHLLKLTEISMLIQAEGWGAGAGFALKEAVALMRDNGDQSLLKNLATDANFIMKNVTTLYEEGHMGEMVSPALSAAKGGAYTALEYGKSAAGFLNPWSYSYFQSKETESENPPIPNEGIEVTEGKQSEEKDSEISSESIQLPDQEIKELPEHNHPSQQLHEELLTESSVEAEEKDTKPSYASAAVDYLNPWSYSYFQGKHESAPGNGKPAPVQPKQQDIGSTSTQTGDTKESHAIPTTLPTNEDASGESLQNNSSSNGEIAATHESKSAMDDEVGDEFTHNLYWTASPRYLMREEALTYSNHEQDDSSSSSSDEEKEPQIMGLPPEVCSNTKKDPTEDSDSLNEEIKAQEVQTHTSPENSSTEASKVAESPANPPQQISPTKTIIPTAVANGPSESARDQLPIKDNQSTEGEEEQKNVRFVLQPELVRFESQSSSEISANSLGQELACSQQDNEPIEEIADISLESLMLEVTGCKEKGIMTGEEVQNILNLLDQAETDDQIIKSVHRQIQALKDFKKIEESGSNDKYQSNITDEAEKEGGTLLNKSLSGSMNIVKKVASYSLARSPQGYALDKIRQIYARRSSGTETEVNDDKDLPTTSHLHYDL